MTQEKQESKPLASDKWREWDLEQCKGWLENRFNQAFERYENGRKEYGPTFVGDPLQQMNEELIDAAFYHWTAERERAELREKLEAARQEIARLQKILNVRGES